MGVLAGYDDLDGFLKLFTNLFVAGLSVQLRERDRRDAVAVHVLAIGATEDAGVVHDVEQIFHALLHVFAVRAFAGEVAGRLKRHQRVAGDGHRVTAFLRTFAPGTIGLLLTGEICQRALDGFIDCRCHLDVVLWTSLGSTRSGKAGDRHGGGQQDG